MGTLGQKMWVKHHWVWGRCRWPGVTLRGSLLFFDLSNLSQRKSTKKSAIFQEAGCAPFPWKIYDSTKESALLSSLTPFVFWKASLHGNYLVMFHTGMKRITRNTKPSQGRLLAIRCKMVGFAKMLTWTLSWTTHVGCTDLISDVIPPTNGSNSGQVAMFLHHVMNS